MKLFELFATLGLDTSEFKKSADNAVEQANQLGEKVTKGLTTKAVFWGNMLNDFTKSAVKTITELSIKSLGVGAEIEAANAQFEATFGELKDSATSAFDAISEEINVLPSRLREVGTQGFAQLKGAGIEANEALSESQRLMRLAADAAAYYDITLEAADDRIRSFMRGNTEAGDAIGLFTSAAQRDTAALEKYGYAWKELTEAERQLLMLDITEEIYNQSGAIGQAARESDSWANILANLKEAWRQSVGAFGAPLTEAFIPTLQSITGFLTTNKEKVAEFGESVADLVGNGLQRVIDAFQWCIDNEEKLAGMLAVAASAFVAIKVAADPVGTTIAAIGAAAVALVANWESVKASLVGVWDSITGAVNRAADAVQSFLGINGKGVGVGIGSSGILKGGGAGKPFFASGTNYVPYDNMPALLHRGEIVLTRQQAEEYRAGNSRSGTDNSAILGKLDDVVSAISGMQVVMDGRSVGVVTTAAASRGIADETRRKRRYG